MIDKSSIDMIDKGLHKMNDLAKRLEFIYQTDEATIDAVNKYLFDNFNDVLAAQYFLIERAEQIMHDMPERGITPEIVAHNYRTIVLLLMYEAYKLGGNKKAPEGDL